MKSFKHLFFTVFIFFNLTFNLICSPSQNVKEFCLENGMQVFILQDFSSAVVSVEFCVKAGFYHQSKDTSGFFTLYSQLVKAENPSINFTNVECNADSSSYALTIPKSQFNKTMDDLSSAIFMPSFSKEVVTTELRTLKNQVLQRTNDVGYFINSSIDSRVFADSPWKHDSGIYPSIFSKTNYEAALATLNVINQKWYTPQNSAIFICGNIEIKEALDVIKETFGRFYSAEQNVGNQAEKNQNTKRKFVLHHKEFSKEMTQIVMQYTSLKNEECDLAAQLFNANNSSAKNALVYNEFLNIPGGEYLNFAGAHKNGTSRLIIQSLLLKPEAKSKLNSFLQTMEFVEQIKNQFEKINQEEFLSAKKIQSFVMNSILNDSATFMNSLCDFWAIEKYYPNYQMEEIQNSFLATKLMNRVLCMNEISEEQILQKLQAEEPFVFVLINSDDFKKNKNEFLKNGFEEVSVLNGSWQTQELFKNMQLAEQNLAKEEKSESENIDLFLQESKNQIKKQNLKNKIPLITKFNQNSSTTTILLNINGGKISSCDNHGFEEVMINILATNIQNEIENQKMLGNIQFFPQVDFGTGITTSYILIECEKEDFEPCVNAISNALIFTDIIPSQADRAVVSRQHKKRLENGSVVNQMIGHSYKLLFPNSSLEKIFEYKNEILQEITYNQILQKYPLFLDAAKYSLIVTGNFPENVKEIFDNSVGILSNLKLNKFSPEYFAKQLDKKTAKIQVNHTFLTDVPAEKAGPMPAILIPTTEFLDPVVYSVKAPEKFTKEEALFKAMLLYLQEELKTQNYDVQVRFENPLCDVAFVIFENVKKTKQIDSAYQKVLLKIKNDFSSSASVEKSLEKIKNIWIMQQISQTQTNSGTALLIQKGFESSAKNPNPSLYLDEYNFIQTANASDFLQTIEFVEKSLLLSVYSKDSN